MCADFRETLAGAWAEIRRQRKQFLNFGRAILYTIIIELVLFTVLLLTSYNLLDWKLIISLVIAEVPIGVFLSILLGERRRREYRIIERFDALARFNHLKIHYSQRWMDADYPELKYFIVNERTSRAYWVQDSVHDLVMAGIIHHYPKYQNSTELEKFFAANEITVIPKIATLQELGIGQGILAE